MIEKNGQFRGENLRLARLLHGLSLEEVGEKVSATRQFIHQIETGAKFPTTPMEEALAEALSIEKHFFRLSLDNTVKEEQCHFRKRATTPAALRQQALARGTVIDFMVSRIDMLLMLPQVNFPDRPVKDAGDIERAAEYVRSHWGLGTLGPIVSMTRVAENAGAIVTTFDSVSDRIDALSMDRPRPIIARSTAKESLCRQRFDIAHEIGHLVMHQGVETGDRETESQAHRFAGAFLIPRASFSKEFPRGKSMNWRSIFEMKLRWKVSARAIIKRAYDLQVIDASQYRSANIYLVKTGQSKVENYDQELPLENPELLSTAFMTLERLGPNTTRNFVREIGLKEQTFEKLTSLFLPKENEDNVRDNVIRLDRVRT